MKNKMTYTEADDLMRKLVDAAYKKHGTYAGAAGMLQSQMAMLLSYGSTEQAVRDIKNLIVELENTNG
jgi:hypothetical protein